MLILIIYYYREVRRLSGEAFREVVYIADLAATARGPFYGRRGDRRARVRRMLPSATACPAYRRARDKGHRTPV